MAHPPHPPGPERRQSGACDGPVSGFGQSLPAQATDSPQVGDTGDEGGADAGGDPAAQGGGPAPDSAPPNRTPPKRALPEQTAARRWRPRWALLLALTAYGLAIWWVVLQIGAAVAGFLIPNSASPAG